MIGKVISRYRILEHLGGVGRCSSTARLPGAGVSLAGISTPAHLDDLLAVARVPPLPKDDYVKLYERSEDG